MNSCFIFRMFLLKVSNFYQKCFLILFFISNTVYISNAEHSTIHVISEKKLYNYLYINYNSVIVYVPWRGGRVVEGSGLENRHSEQLSRVRIPLSPLFCLSFDV